MSDCSDSWNGLDNLTSMSLGTCDFANPPWLKSSPATSWPISGTSTARSPTSLSDISFSPVLPDPGLATVAGTGSTLPGAQWRVLGVQKLDSSDQGHIQAVTARCSRSMTLPIPAPPLKAPMSPQMGIRPSTHHLQQTSGPSPNQSMENSHKDHLSTQPCLRCGYHNPHSYARPAITFEHGASIAATAVTPAPLSQKFPCPGFGLSEYGIDTGNLAEPPIVQVNSNGPRVVHLDEQNSSHYSIWGSTPSSSHQQVTQRVPQQATRQESNAGQGQEKVVLVYLQSTKQAS